MIELSKRAIILHKRLSRMRRHEYRGFIIERGESKLYYVRGQRDETIHIDRTYENACRYVDKLMGGNR